MHSRLILPVAFSGLLLLSACSPSHDAPAAAGGPQAAPAEVLDKLLTNAETPVISAAEAMPAEKFNFAPSPKIGTFSGVRTFAQEINHVSAANYDLFRDWGVPGGKDPKAVEALTDRDQILDTLKDSFKYAHKAIATITPENAFQGSSAVAKTHLSTAVLAIAHPNDHYGQMVEYLRMNGIVPPASRK